MRRPLQDQIKKVLPEWIDNHPDVWDGHFHYVQNALGTILGYPDWYGELIDELLKERKSE